MNVRKGLMLTVVLAMSAGGAACASGGGGGGGGTSMEDLLAGATGSDLEQGIAPTENEFTEEAESRLEAAAEAATPEAARPELEAALAAAEQAIALDDTNPLGHLLAARAALGLEDYEAAGAHFDRAEELRPIYQLQTEGIREQAWIALYQEASPFVESGEYERAAEIFEQANAIYDRRPEVMITLGQIYATLGDADRAVANLRQAQDLINSPRIEEMDSTTAAEWRAQGEEIPAIITQALLQARQYEAAAEELRGLLAEDPSDMQNLQLLGNVYAQMGQADSAQAIFSRLMESGTEISPQQLYQIGVGFYQLEDWMEAAEAFRRAAETSPMDRDAIEMWARSLQILNQEAGDSVDVPPARLTELMQAGERWAELDPFSRNAYLIMAQTANLMQDDDRARELVEQIESMPVTVQDLQLRRRQGGGGTVTGSLRNLTGTPGSTATLEVTFYDQAGTAIATETVQVSLPAAEASEVFRVELDSDQEVGGYGYELTL